LKSINLSLANQNKVALIKVLLVHQGCQEKKENREEMVSLEKKAPMEKTQTNFLYNRNFASIVNQVI
jgi:hypothetical protein